MKIKLMIFLVGLLLITSPLRAFTLKGKVVDMPLRSKVYLFTSAPGQVEQKWTLSYLVDSTVANKNGEFEFQVQDADYARLWRVAIPGKTLKYFFSKNEDLIFRGKMANLGLREEVEEVVGRDEVLFKDMLSMMEKEKLTPVKRRVAIEWLKRHAREDIAVWATAYFYMADSRLAYREVSEILTCIPAKQYRNPFYRLMLDYHNRLGRIQPGKKYELPELKDATGKQLPASFGQGHPLLIFSCRDTQLGAWYVQKCKQLIRMTEKFPGLHLLLLCMPFSDEKYNQVLNAMQNERVLTYDLSVQHAIDPLTLNICRNSGSILLNSGGEVLSLESDLQMLEECLIKNPESVKAFCIKGYVEGMEEGVAELVTVTREGSVVMDTACIRNGYFHFYGQTAYPQYCNIGIRGTLYPVALFLENGIIDVNIGARSAYYEEEKVKILEGKVYGSPLYDTYFSFIEINDDREIEAWIRKHPKDFASFFRIYALVDKRSADVIERWLACLDPVFKVHPGHKEIVKLVSERKRISVGSIAPDFILPDSKGEKIALETFRGKYVLLDFWASWCGPCRAEIPHLKELWKQFHTRGFEIISVSIDYTEQAWQKALSQENMPWPQLFAKDTEVSKLYLVEAVPFSLLLDRKGKIIGVNLSREELLPKLTELLGQE